MSERHVAHIAARESAAQEPVDSDIDLHRGRAQAPRRDEATVLVLVAAGGALGAGARYLIGAFWPVDTVGFPASTLAVNVLGCALIGVLMVLITEVWSTRRHLRPFLGTGLLGGFTTFSTYTIGIQQLLDGSHADIALLYLVATPLSALLAVWATATTTRRLVGRRMP